MGRPVEYSGLGPGSMMWARGPAQPGPNIIYMGQAGPKVHTKQNIHIYQILINVLVCRFEKLKLQTRAGKIKCVGALLCIGGALALILYKGLSFHNGHHHHHHTASRATANQSHSHWARGTILLVGACLSYATWCKVQVRMNSPIYTSLLSTCSIHDTLDIYVNIFLYPLLQVKLLEVFPLKYWGVMLQCLLLSLQSAVIGLCLNTSTNA